MAKDKESIFLRLDSNLASSIKDLARKTNLSINEYCSLILENKVKNSLNLETGDFVQLISQAQDEYIKNLKSVVLFGSYARGEETEESDIDILIILDEKIKITRALYAEWEKRLGELSNKFSIHFVNLPNTFNSLSGLWCEVAQEGIVLYDFNFEVSRFFISLREKILLGHYRSSYSHGHRYWIYEKEAA